MPSRGNNLQRFRAHFLFLLQRYYGAVSSFEWPDDLIFHLLSTAEENLCDESGLKKRDTSVTVTAGTAGPYTLPTDCKATGIHEIRFKGTSDQAYGAPLGERDFATLIQSYEALASDPARGTPQVWAYDPADLTKIYLGLTPSVGGTLHIEYEFVPTPLWRIWQPAIASYKASAIYSSAAITVSAAIPEGVVETGDEFGIVPSTAVDGTTLTEATPLAWFKIQSAVGVTITLTEAWPMGDVSNAAFFTAQVPDLEKRFPARAGLSIVEYAVADALFTTNPQASELLRRKALGRLPKLMPNQTTVETTVAPRSRTPFFSG